MMKKLLLILLLLLPFYSVAQLPTSFYGLKLRDTPESECSKYLSNAGFNVDKPVNSNGVIAYGFIKNNFVDFRTPWNFGSIFCYDNKFMQIDLDNVFSNENSAKEVYNHTLNYLKEAYGNYLKSEERNSATFCDGKTTCKLYLSTGGSKTTLTLEFY